MLSIRRAREILVSRGINAAHARIRVFAGGSHRARLLQNWRQNESMSPASDRLAARARMYTRFHVFVRVIAYGSGQRRDKRGDI